MTCAELASSQLASGLFLLVGVMPTLQMILGITTLLMFVPVDLGTAHQGGGIMVLSAYLLLFHTLRGPAGGAALAKAAAKMAK